MLLTKVRMIERELSEVKKEANKLKRELSEQGRNHNSNNDYRCLQQKIAKLKGELASMEVTVREKEAKRLERIGSRRVTAWE